MYVLFSYFDSILNGLLYTVILTIIPTILGIIFGLVLSFFLIDESKFFRFWFATIFIEIVRAVPPLVWLVWIYFALPILLDIRLDSLSSSLIVFTVIYASFAADIFRGAIRAIPNSTIDSALSLGMNKAMLLKRVILTEIFRRSFAAINGQTVGFLKMSSLASIIAVPELTHTFQLILIKTPLPYEVYTGMAISYCLLILPTVWVMRKIEQLPTFKLNPISK